MKKIITVKKSRKEILIFEKKYPEAINLTYVLAKSNATLDLFLKLIGKGKGAVKINLQIVHKAKSTISRVVLRCALSDSFRAHSFGNVKIQKNAKGADANLDMKTLLLSNKAWAISEPFMEISTDDAHASHGAAVGRIDPNALFYLQSRGLGKKQAQEILLNDFLCE